MKYSEMQYTRPDVTEVGEKFNGLIDKFENTNSFKEADETISSMNNLRNEFETMKIIAFINYSNDTNNAESTLEQDYFDNCSPIFSENINKYYKVLQNSKFKEQLIEKYGKQLFTVAGLAMKSFDPLIVEDLQKENHLCSNYTKLKASAKIMFDGTERNLQDLEPFMESPDREIRKKAFDAYWKFFSDNAKEFDVLYDKLVKLRNDMAVKLGYKNFVELGYARMKRADYDYDMVEKFRKNIRKYIVPLASKLRKKQKERIGVDKLMVYDVFLQFKSGNATPKGRS